MVNGRDGKLGQNSEIKPYKSSSSWKYVHYLLRRRDTRHTAPSTTIRGEDGVPRLIASKCSYRD